MALEPGIDLLVTLLATLKSGSVYLPLDPAYPVERIRHMLADSRADMVVTDGATRGRLRLASMRSLVLDDEVAALEAAPTSDPLISVGLDDLAFVLYTSGSTGRPKGVEGDHRMLVARVMNESPPFDEGERTCFKTSPNFIDALWEILSPLVRGMSVAIATSHVRRDPARLVRLLADAAVTRLVLVPSLLSAILDVSDDLASRLPLLRQWIATGESLSWELCARFHASVPSARLTNLYGTSESWDVAQFVCVEEPAGDARRVPIGRPLENVQVRVADRTGGLIPLGAVGELRVSGPSLARGYRGLPDLTAEMFDHAELAGGGRAYRTGDLARWRSDGMLELVGRADGQLKLRGHRIEPAEIEAALAAHPRVARAAVGLHEAAGAPRLVGYVVAREHPGPGAAELRAHLREHLPAAMIPSAYIDVSAIPLTPSGKTDRLRLGTLATIGNGDEQSPFIEPSSRTERRLAEAWQSTLGLERVSIDANFFECGGDSLLAMTLMSVLSRALDRPLPVSLVFEVPTIAEMAEAVDSSVEMARMEVVPRVERRAFVPGASDPEGD